MREINPPRSEASILLDADWLRTETREAWHSFVAPFVGAARAMALASRPSHLGARDGGRTNQEGTGAASGGAAPGDLFQRRSTQPAPTTEQAVAGKQTVIAEELTLRNDVEYRIETMSDTVRHTEIEVGDTLREGAIDLVRSARTERDGR